MINLAFLSAAHVHFDRFVKRAAELDGVRISHVWDDDADRGARKAQAAGAEFVVDLDKVCSLPSVDGYVICSPNDQRLELLTPAIASGKPIMCEKPISLSVAEARKIRQLLRDRPSSLSTGFFRVGYGGYLKVREMVQQRALGRVTHIAHVNKLAGALERSFDKPDLQWFVNPKRSGGGALVDLGSHSAHLLAWLMGEADEVLSFCSNLSGNYPDVDDYGVAHIRFKSGAIGNVEAGWTTIGGINTLSVFGEAGSIVGTNDDSFDRDLRLRHYRSRHEFETIEPNPDQPTRIDRLVAQIRGELPGEQLDAELQAAFAAVAIMEAASRSARDGGWVKVEAV